MELCVPVLFFGHIRGMWKFPGEGLNLCQSSDNTRSSTARPPGNSCVHVLHWDSSMLLSAVVLFHCSVIFLVYPFHYPFHSTVGGHLDYFKFGAITIKLPWTLKKNFFFNFLLFGSTPEAYGSSQARGQTRAVAAGLHRSHSNAGSLTHWVSPELERASSWILVGFISAAQQQKLPALSILACIFWGT